MEEERYIFRESYLDCQLRGGEGRSTHLSHDECKSAWALCKDLSVDWGRMDLMCRDDELDGLLSMPSRPRADDQYRRAA